MGEPQEIDPDDEIITCWCGAKGTYEQLFDDHLFDEGCGGTSVLYCECGGDNLCVCHWHGDVECPGCEDCEPDDDDDIVGVGDYWNPGDYYED